MPKPSYAELKADNEKLVADNEKLVATNKELVANNEEALATNKELVANNEELKNTITALNSRLKKEMKPTKSDKFKDIHFNAGMWFKDGKAYNTIEDALNG